MIAADSADRLARLGKRWAIFRDGLAPRTPEAHQKLILNAWRAIHGPEGDEPAGAPSEAVADEAERAVLTSRLDAILSLLERVTRPSRWLDEQASWFDRAQFCLLDAVARLGPDAPVPPPILAVEPIDSPLYVPRARAPGAWLAQATPADLPLPVVLCPGNLLEEPWAWATLLHELGHHLDAALKDTESLLPALGEADGREPLGLWTDPRWVREVVADLYAGLLGGPGAVRTLLAAFTTRAATSSHPSDEDRARVLSGAWAGVLGDPLPDEATTEPAEIVIRSLAARFSAFRERAQEDARADLRGPVSPRLIPGLLFLRSEEDRDWGFLRRECTSRFKGLLAEGKGPQWVLTEAHLDTLAQAMKHLVETQVEPGTGALKVPPLPLLLRHDRVAFVGATHGQLLPKLRDAIAQRKKPFERIELFALQDEPLKKLLLDKKTGQDLVDERDAALRAIHDLLKRAGIPHEIRLFEDPYFFASFWDAEDNERRPADSGAPPAHIHTSAALWGMDLRRAPGHDREAPPGQPLPPSMAPHVQALAHLRNTSSLFPLD